jgi:hypothetical protein
MKIYDHVDDGVSGMVSRVAGASMHYYHQKHFQSPLRAYLVRTS